MGEVGGEMRIRRETGQINMEKTPSRGKREREAPRKLPDK